MELVTEPFTNIRRIFGEGMFRQFPIFSRVPTIATGIPVLHDSIGGSGWDLVSGGKRVGELHVL